jgi:hypothetical protein
MTTPTPNRRWYHLTPARFFIGLLVVQVVLLLSERFQWFAFNQNKGWAVLIAVGVVVVAVLVMLTWGLVCFLLRRRFQFRVRSLLVFLLAVSLPLGWFAWEMQRARRQREAVEGIEKVGGEVSYDFLTYDREWARPPAWLQRWLGDDFFFDVETVILATMADVGDGDVRHLKVLSKLEFLSLNGMDVTDAGLQQVQGLAELETLYLSSPQITDDGLEHLMALTNLKFLLLGCSQVTDEGVKRLQQELPNCEIDF